MINIIVRDNIGWLSSVICFWVRYNQIAFIENKIRHSEKIYVDELLLKQYDIPKSYKDKYIYYVHINLEWYIFTNK